ncbi:MAG: DNA mismatch repair protein MutS [Flavobacteriaceae bacterium]|nr:DNA mismatch repair protein MutS [Flavobacteriaceae bacterium]
MKKRRSKRLLQELKNSWGKPKQDTYYHFSQIARFFDGQIENPANFQVISEQTADDLDFEELFKFLDRTTSKVGQQYLFKKLRVILPKKEQFPTIKLAKIVSENEQFRLAIQQQLYRLSSLDAYDLVFWTQKKNCEKQHYQSLLYILTFGAVLCLLLGIYKPFFFVLLLPIFAVNAVFHYINKAKLSYSLSGIRQLAVAYEVGEKFASDDTLKGYFDVSFLKEIAKFQSKIRLIGAEKDLDSEVAQLVWFVTEIFKILFNFETLLFYHLEKSLVQNQKAILKLFEFIGEIDVAVTVANLRAENKTTCEPLFTAKKQIITEELYHPLLENCVANDLELNGKSLLLTGTNMSGKTTFIRTIGVNSLLAQTLGFCYAKSCQAPFLKIYASIKITDNLLENTSYYLQEVLNIKGFVDVLHEDTFSLFILDELFKGTNTTERIASAGAVLSYLNTEKSIVLVSTHDVELTELLEEKKYQLHCFDEQITDNKIAFSYKLKNGIPQHRNAIKILELYNYPSAIFTEATKIAEEIS